MENLTFEKNGATQAYADDLIGAAQRLERAARFLKDQAKVVREHGLLKVESPIYRDSQAAYVLSVAQHAADEIIAGKNADTIAGKAAIHAVR